jgi:hypothetical protein
LRDALALLVADAEDHLEDLLAADLDLTAALEAKDKYGLVQE